MATRATHIEIVSDLSSVAFLMLLHRFTAILTALYSDCGTNFIGASHYLDLADDQIQAFAGSKKICWVFNPAWAPYRDGIWEAAVIAAKSHLTWVVGNTVLNLEEYFTLFTRITSILNPRPLCYHRSSASSTDFILVPSHFLIGSPSYIVPEPDESKLLLMKQYLLLRTFIDSFWKVWWISYLSMLQKKENGQLPNTTSNPDKLSYSRIQQLHVPGQWPSLKKTLPTKMTSCAQCLCAPALANSSGTFAHSCHYQF